MSGFVSKKIIGFVWALLHMPKNYWVTSFTLNCPPLKKILHQNEEACVLESVKAAADVYAPLSGIITEINTSLNDTPGLINSDSYDQGWLFRMQFSDVNELGKLLDFTTYEQQILVKA